MITELKEAINLLQSEEVDSKIVAKVIFSLSCSLASLESQEARLREWEVREKCDSCGGVNPQMIHGELRLCLMCVGTGFITRPATFDDVMDVIDKIYMTDKKVTVISKLSDSRELRREK